LQSQAAAEADGTKRDSARYPMFSIIRIMFHLPDLL